ncbi:hypothetical protein DPMN_069542 [Dreissena polymorpha]|uniref:Uncharacterized protein n=1 Tax=Dreissena polymorpha TaxID=45954 RepID=A0A9D3Z3S6_DREPO|nr:hypothetical protein DPMN_069542 [Dreissena polymorpha]
MGKSGKKRSKEEASPNFVNDHPDKVLKMATNTPPASNPTTTTPPPYGTPMALETFMPPHLHYLTQQSPAQFAYMYAPASPQNVSQAHTATPMDADMYNTILSKLNSIEATKQQMQTKLLKLDQIKIDVKFISNKLAMVESKVASLESKFTESKKKLSEISRILKVIQMMK